MKTARDLIPGQFLRFVMPSPPRYNRIVRQPEKPPQEGDFQHDY